MSEKDALIVALLQRNAALQKALQSQSRTLGEWQQFSEDHLPKMKHLDDCTTLRLLNSTVIPMQIDFNPLSGSLFVSAFQSVRTNFDQVSKIVVSRSNDAFHLRILCGQKTISVHEQPGRLDMKGRKRCITLDYPRDHLLGFGENFMAFLHEIQAHHCNFEVVIQE